MSFVAPGQILRIQDEEADYTGMSLNIHSDFLRSYALNTTIKQYSFFGYSAAEALYLSQKEKVTIMNVYTAIQEEQKGRIDKFSQDVIISQVELLLNYSNRFYDRQFITRKAVNNDIISRLDVLLENYFNDEASLMTGLPSVSFVAGQLLLTPRYLSDLLRNLIGQNAQQYIHEKLIEKAKSLLAKDNYPIAEIAFRLGFEHPQSFNKLFKDKTSLSSSDYKKELLN